jgi:hypothetical protein
MSVLFNLLFAVYLDEQRIGEHRFTLVERGAERELVSEARFRVSVLGIPAYRYTHQATERWRGDCLQSLASRTDDDGKPYRVDWRSASGCTMSFAYWNPRILGERALLNAQTGELEPVRVEPLGDGRWRLAGGKLAIELRYEGSRWVALDTITAGGRRLRYRLETAS